MNSLPRVLYVNTTLNPMTHKNSKLWAASIDYSEYLTVPRRFRTIEQMLRLDFLLALKVRKMAKDFDVIFAGSERVGIPLAYLKLDRPLITVVHHIASLPKKELMKFAKPHLRWHNIGYLSRADCDFMRSEFGVSQEKMFRFIAAPLSEFTPSEEEIDGPIISVGASKRDYQTLIDAMRSLPNYPIEIYPSSQFYDLYDGDLSELPRSIMIKPHISQQEIAAKYAKSPFMVLPLHDTTQFSAGVSTALEAAAAGKAIIATHTKGMPDYVIDGRTGILVPPGDIESLRQAICKLIEEPQLAQEMGRNARKHVERHFDPAEIERSTQKVIENLCQ